MGLRPVDAADPDVAAADPGVAVGAVVEAAGPDVDVAEAAVGPDVADCVVVAVVVLGAAGPDVADCVVVAVAAAAGPDVAVVVAVAVAAPRASGAVLLPIARKMSHNTRFRCDEETFYMLGKHGRHASAKPR
jgi:hypothetical protein